MTSGPFAKGVDELTVLDPEVVQETIAPQTDYLDRQFGVMPGGTMLYNTSPNDPVFFLDHANIDRLWAEWQDQHGLTFGGAFAFIAATGLAATTGADDSGALAVGVLLALYQVSAALATPYAPRLCRDTSVRLVFARVQGVSAVLWLCAGVVLSTLLLGPFGVIASSAVLGATSAYVTVVAAGVGAIAVDAFVVVASQRVRTR